MELDRSFGRIRREIRRFVTYTQWHCWPRRDRLIENPGCRARKEQPDVVWFPGRPGVRATRHVLDQYSPATVRHEWCDNYWLPLCGRRRQSVDALRNMNLSLRNALPAVIAALIFVSATVP